MAGLQAHTPTPESLTVHGASRVLEVSYSDGKTFRIPFELLRVYSPSAEVQGHGPGQEVLQTGKREVGINTIEPVGNYAIKPFSATAMKAVFSPGNTCTSWAASRMSCGSNICSACRRRVWIATHPCPRRAPAAMAAACTEIEI